MLCFFFSNKERRREAQYALLVLRNKICDQLYGRDASQEVSVREKVSLQHTPSPLYISGSPTMQ
jgi:hypothetical protein